MNKELFYRIDALRILRRVYNAKNNALLREIVDFDKIVEIAESLSRHLFNGMVENMRMGVKALIAAEENDYAGLLPYDEDIDIKASMSNEMVCHYLLMNFSIQFGYQYSLFLLENTYVEDFLDMNLKLIKFTLDHVIFKYSYDA